MTPEALARLHAACFTTPRPWTAPEFADLLARPLTHLITDPHGFALVEVIVPEAELLTLAVDPAHRRHGLGRALLTRAIAAAHARGAASMHLEVAADNAPARALYARAGFQPAGTRPGYYRRPDGSRIDAEVLVLASLGPNAPVHEPESG